MYCTNCGTNLPDGIKYCSTCGTDLSSTDDNSRKERSSDSRFIPAICNRCGANLTVDSNQGSAVCPYCNTAYTIDRPSGSDDSNVFSNREFEEEPKDYSATGQMSYHNSKSSIKEPFYANTLFVVFLLLWICFPAGLYLMWKYEKFNKPARIVISLFYLLIFLVGLR